MGRAERIAALRNMTVARGCTVEEADTAKRILDEMLGEGGEEASRSDVLKDVWDQQTYWRGADKREAAYRNTDEFKRREAARRAAAQEAADVHREAEERNKWWNQREAAAKAASEKREREMREQAEADRENMRKWRAQVEAERRAAEEAEAAAKRAAEEAAAAATKAKKAAADAAAVAAVARAKAERAEREAADLKKRVEAKRRVVGERDAKLDAIENSPFLMKEALTGGKDTCPLCHNEEALEIMIHDQRRSIGSMTFHCIYCNAYFSTIKIMDKYWMYRTIDDKSGRKHRF